MLRNLATVRFKVRLELRVRVRVKVRVKFTSEICKLHNAPF